MCDPSPRRLPAVDTRSEENLERRDGRPRSVRGQMNPEYRKLRFNNVNLENLEKKCQQL